LINCLLQRLMGQFIKGCYSKLSTVQLLAHTCPDQVNLEPAVPAVQPEDTL
jgi:hypothetical protein